MKEKNFFPSLTKPEVNINVDKYIEFDSEELSEILGWSVGSKYRLELLVKEVSESKDSEQERVIAKFKIIDVTAKRTDMPDHINKLINNIH